MAHVDVAGRKVYYELHGDRNSSGPPPLVLLNGISGSCRGWLPLQVPDLSKDRQVLIFDHRGVGESEDPGGAFTTADLADDTAALLDALEEPDAKVRRRAAESLFDLTDESSAPSFREGIADPATIASLVAALQEDACRRFFLWGEKA